MPKIDRNHKSDSHELSQENLNAKPIKIKGKTA